METYVIVRRGGWRTADDLAAAAERSTAEGERMPDDVALDPQLRARGARRRRSGRSASTRRRAPRRSGATPAPRTCRSTRSSRSPTRSSSGLTPHWSRRDRALQHARHARAARDAADAEDAPRSGGRGWPGTARARSRDRTAGRRNRGRRRSDRERRSCGGTRLSCRACANRSSARRWSRARSRSRTRASTTPGPPTTGSRSARGSEARCAVPRASAATRTRSRPCQLRRLPRGRRSVSREQGDASSIR